MSNAKKRIKIPNEIDIQLLYRCANKCCICRSKATQIHHIDENPSNNNLDNLVYLCSRCHDEAHTYHSLSKNLTPEKLHKLKIKWGKEVEIESSKSMIPTYTLPTCALWCYFNFEKLIQFYKSSNIKFDKHQLLYLSSNNITDNNGFPHWKDDNLSLETIYDRMDYASSLKFYDMYKKSLEKFIKKSIQ